MFPTFPELVSSWTFVPLSTFLLHSFFFPFRYQEARDLFFATLSNKGFFCASLSFFFFFLFHFFSFRFFWALHLLTGASQVLGSSPWLFIWWRPTPPPLMFSSKVLGSLPWQFLSRVLGSLPWLFPSKVWFLSLAVFPSLPS